MNKAKSRAQGSFVSEGGWAAMPGMAAVDAAMANRCAEIMVAAKP